MISKRLVLPFLSFLLLLALVLAVLPVAGVSAADENGDRVPTVGPSGGSATADQLAMAMDIPSEYLVSASLGSSDSAGTHRFTSLPTTSTGFIYPTGAEPTCEESYGYDGAITYYQYAGWLAKGNSGDDGDYVQYKYHIGQDIPANENSPVYAIGDGRIEYVSYGGWDANNWEHNNCGIFVRHYLSDGSAFLALYGHIKISSVKQADKLPTSSAPVTEDIWLTAGEPFAEIGDFGNVDHLHFGIFTDTTVPGTHEDTDPEKTIGLGRMGLKNWADPPTEASTNGFVDPIKWITTKTPKCSVNHMDAVGFPTEGKTFAAISSGVAANAILPNNSGSLSGTLGGLNNSQGNDLVQLTLTLKVPSGAEKWTVDWKFLSEEYPEWVGTQYNDTFLIETPSSTFTISGNSVAAPNNVALDEEKHLVTVNTTGKVGMKNTNSAGTTYDGATATLTAGAPIPSGASVITIVFSIMDLGDSIYDSTVFLDNFKFLKPILVDPLETNSFLVLVPPDQVQAIFSTSWSGSDVIMTLTAPSGRVIDRNTAASDVVHNLGFNWETYTVANPQAGDWLVSLYGADVPPEGEEVLFALLFSAAPPLNQPPVADAGPDQVVEQTSLAGAEVTLNGSGSSDPDGDPLTYTWTWAGGSASGATLAVVLPMGTTEVILEVSDGVLPDTDEVSITVQDTTPPSVAMISPPSGYALQDGVTFVASSTDGGSGVNSVTFSIREDNGGGGIPVGFEGIPATYNSGTGYWTLSLDTLQLPDGYYVVLVEATDNAGNIGSITVPYSIRNWAVLELLPATPNNNAGRSMPVKFSLRVAAAVDPAQPFVYNDDLTIKILGGGNVLQTSVFGLGSRNYRIDTAGEKYITNFQTSKVPMMYTVQIWRTGKNFLVGSFTFRTVK